MKILVRCVLHIVHMYVCLDQAFFVEFIIIILIIIIIN